MNTFLARTTLGLFDEAAFHVGFDHPVRTDDAHLTGGPGSQDVHRVRGPDVVFVGHHGNPVVKGVFSGVKEAQIRRFAAVLFGYEADVFPDVLPGAGLVGEDIEIIRTRLLEAARTALLPGLGVGRVVGQTGRHIDALGFGTGHPIEQIEVMTGLGDPEPAAELLQPVPAAKIRFSAIVVFVGLDGRNLAEIA